MAWMWKAHPQKKVEKTAAPFWRQSGASMHERTFTGKKELRRLENAYGRISFLAEKDVKAGVSEKNRKVAVEVARKNIDQEEQLPQSSRKLEEHRMSSISMDGGKGYVDSHLKQESAFRWTESVSLPAERVMGQLRRLTAQLDQKVLSEMMPEANKEQEIHGHSQFFRKLEQNLRESMVEIREEEQLGKEVQKQAVNSGWRRNAGAQEVAQKEGQERAQDESQSEENESSL